MDIMGKRSLIQSRALSEEARKPGRSSTQCQGGTCLLCTTWIYINDQTEKTVWLHMASLIEMRGQGKEGR